MSGTEAHGPVQVVWRVPGYGFWRYCTELRLRERSGSWKIQWVPQVVHPALSAGTRLGSERVWATRAPILDRHGTPLVRDRPVIEVGLQRNHVTDVAASARALATALGLDPATLAREVRGAGPQEFVLAETLRSADYDQIAARLKSVPGMTAIPATLPLAPTRAFARALLGTVGPASAAQVNASGGTVAAGDDVGQWGLEAAYDRRLGGSPTVSIVVRATATGAPLQMLASHPGASPAALATTLSTKAQLAAEAALGTSARPTALVALQPSTGDILAVANRPVDSSFNRALAGAYAPGSTFKVITTAALLRQGFDPQQQVACPQTITVDGRSFHNFEGEAAGQPTFPQDFAISCNTAFISLAGRLPASALGTTALDYGLGRNANLPFGTAQSHVPPGGDAVSRAATMIGQDRIVATPLAMAGVAAAVADGRWRAPRLLSTDRTVVGPALPPHEVATLRTLMRGVVTSGTGNALAGVPGSVAGKTGTAEFGSGNPPPTHAWFICFRGDLALAVLVENGRSGQTVAAPIAAGFFTAYDSLRP